MRRSRHFLLLGLLAALALGPARAEEGEYARAAALGRVRALHERLQLAPRDSYLNYAIATIARRADLDLEREGIDFPLVPVVTGDPAHRTDLFGVATGAHAIEQSLQLTELMAPDGWDAEATLDIESLVPPRVPAHEIELGPDAARHANSEAARLPADWLYLRVKDGASLVALCRETELWARHVLTFYQEDARAPVELGRAFERLGLPDPREASAAYATVKAPIAVGLADPFLREGTALTVILPGGPTGKVLGALVPGDRVSEDGRVTRYRAEIDGRVVLSTSRAALARLTRLPAAETMAASPDYLDMRARLPRGEDEAAFVFLSDAFVRRMVSPGLKIRESRRLRCSAHLRTIVNAALLHAEERGVTSGSIDALAAGEYLTAATLRCPDGGAYALERGLEPDCSVHGRPGALRPLLDLPLGKITATERRAYRRYARAYEALWRQYVDPVGVQFVRDGDAWSAEAVILPLVNSALYRNLARVSGGPPVEGGAGPIAPGTVFLVSARLQRSWVRDLRADPLGLEDRFGANLRDVLLEGLGGRVTLGLIDDRMLFDYDLVGFMAHTLRWNVDQDVLLAPLLAGLNLPAYVTASVDDRARVEAWLETLRRGVVRAAARPGGGMFTLRVESYALERPEGPSIETLTVGIGAFELRLYVALGERELVVATRPEVVEAVLRDGTPDPDPTPYGLKLALYPSRWEKLGPDMMLGYEEAARAACGRAAVELEAFRGVGLEAFARALGRHVSCPDGGTWVEEDGRELACSIHGTPARPRLPSTVPPENPTARLLRGTSAVTFALRFEDDGLRIRIVRR